MFRYASLTAALIATSLLAPAPAPAPKVVLEKREPGDNKNSLITKHKDKLKLSASTIYNGWPVEKLVDGDLTTSWFSATGDSVAKGTIPWVEIEFPEDVTVAQVTIFGNREVSYPTGYSVLAGSLELFDKDGKRLHKEDAEGAGEQKDFNYSLKQALPGVRKIRFTSTKDQGDVNGSMDVALGEIFIDGVRAPEDKKK